MLTGDSPILSIARELTELFERESLDAAIIGGVAGAVAGNLIGKAPTAGDCVYQNPDGSRYVARCPA